MDQMKHFRFEVLLEGGCRLETTFSQRLDDGQMPAMRFYLGYSTDRSSARDLPWISVGTIGYSPDKALGVRIAEVDGKDGMEVLPEAEAQPAVASRNGKRD